MPNGCWSSFNAFDQELATVRGLATGQLRSTCPNAAVAGIASGMATCFGPAFFFQRLQAYQGVNVCICTENGRCVNGQIIEVCNDYLTLNSNGILEIIPLFQITRLSLAPMMPYSG